MIVQFRENIDDRTTDVYFDDQFDSGWNDKHLSPQLDSVIRQIIERAYQRGLDDGHASVKRQLKDLLA